MFDVIQASEENGEVHQNVQKEDLKKQLIQQFALNQIANVPLMFRHCLTVDYISQCLDVLVSAAYFPGESQNKDVTQMAQFKLFNFVQHLQKVKVADNKKGFANNTDLWSMKINVKIYKLAKDNHEMEDLAKNHKDYIKFIKDNISTERTRIKEIVDSTTNEEMKLKATAEFKKIIAIEQLFLSLTMLILLPGDM